MLCGSLMISSSIYLFIYSRLVIMVLLISEWIGHVEYKHASYLCTFDVVIYTCKAEVLLLVSSFNHICHSYQCLLSCMNLYGLYVMW